MTSLFDLPIGAALVLLAATWWVFKRFKRRFSLREMFVAVFIASLPFAWLASCVRDYARERQAISILREKGIDVRSSSFRRWGQQLFLGEALTERVFAVYARSTKVTSEDFKLIGRFHFLSVLVANDADIADEDLAHLRSMPRLRELRLPESHLTGTGLAYLDRVKLEDVDLSFTALNDDGLRNLATCPTLEELRLDGTKITDKGLAQLAGHAKLQVLSLNHTDITDAGLLDVIPTLPRLRDIDVSNVVVARSTLDQISERGVHVHSSILANSKSHREAITQLALRNVYVRGFSYIHRSEGSDRCSVNIGADWRGSPDVAGFLRALPGVGSVNLDSAAVDGEAIDLLLCFQALMGLRITGANINDADLTRLANQEHPVLRYIHLERTAVTAQGLVTLGKLPALRNLYVDGVVIDGSTVESFATLRQLEWLQLPQSSLNDEAAFRLRVALPHTRIKLDDSDYQGVSRRVSCTSDEAEHVINDLSVLSELEVLTINCPKLEPESLSRLRHLSRLRDLSLHVGDFRGIDLTWLIELPNLRKLTLHGDSMEEAVSQLPGNIPRVVMLNIFSASSSNEWINQIGQLNGLERLRISGQSNRPLDVSPLAGMPALETLDISFGHFTDAHLPSLVPLPELRALTVSGVGVTDRSVEVFTKFSKLRRLNLSHTGISESGRGRLRALLPQTEVVADHLEAKKL